MSEVRLVRCPKCDKVLPEPSGCPVYQCGGCGAVLRAKKKLSEENLVNSCTTDLYKEPLVKERNINMDSRSPLRLMVENGDENSFPFRDNGLTEFHGGFPKSPMRERFLEDLGNTPMVSREASRSPMGEERSDSDYFAQDGINSPARSSNASRSPLRGRARTPVSMRTKDISRPRTREGTSSSDLEGVGRSSTVRSMNGEVPQSPLKRGLGNKEQEGVRKMTPKASFDAWLTGDKHEELSGGGRRSIMRDRAVDRQSASVRGYDRPNVVDQASNDHPRHQLSGSDNGDMYSPGIFSEPDGKSEYESLRIRGGPMQKFPLDRTEHRPSHLKPEDMYYANHPRYNQHPSKHTAPDYYQDRRGPGVNDAHAHHPACSCSLCSKNDWQGQDRRGNHNMVHERYDPRSYDPRMASSGPRGRTSHPVHQRRRSEVASLNKRLCRPISGGAPFVLCDNCFQLLILSRNCIAKHKNQQLKCGACSTLISFDLQIKSADILSPQKKRDSVHEAVRSGEVTDVSSPKHRRGGPAGTSTNIGSYDFDGPRTSIQSMDSEAIGRSKGHVAVRSSEVTNVSSPKHRRGGPAGTSTDIGSYDFDPPRTSFQSMDSEASRPSEGQILLNPTSKFAPSPSRFPVEEHIGDTADNQRNSPETPMLVRPPPGSPLRDHLDFSSQFNKHQAPEKQSIDEDPLNITEPCETEVPINELPTTGLSQDSMDVPRETQSAGNGKAVQSPIDTILQVIKSGSASGSGHRLPLRAEVYVNGQAISHRSVKRAEKLAGEIQPGEYWYDSKAGFWGVMGRRCLGIIPPSIQEFNFPMAENCSNGNSAVYVNGRELPEEDLELLSARGLPTTRDRHYIVDISGKVLDADTLDFIVNLGRLAPSVERKKCGFGMQVPERLAD